MANVVEERKFSLFNVDGHHNKFWNIKLFDNGDVEVHYGSQGETGQRKSHSGVGRSYFDKKIREKTSSSHHGGAYTENKVLGTVESVSSPSSVSKTELHRKAITDMGANQPELASLIRYFADVNAHNLWEASGGKITYDADAGTFRTTQGVITLDQVQQARALLDQIAVYSKKSDFSSDDFKASINPYLSLIPQKGLVRHLDFADMFSQREGIQKQTDILDGLETSYAAVLAAPKPKEGVKEESKLFKVSMDVAGGKDVDFVRKFYRETKGNHSDVQHYDVKAVWNLKIDHMFAGFQNYGRKMTNIWRLFHGTKASNMLSILKAGFVMPRQGTSVAITGWLWGSGIYFSDMSTKSIRYATGAWSGGAGARDRKFMFICEVAMGNYNVPSDREKWSYKLPRGYDSCFAQGGAQGGKSGVINNEMVVFNTNQINPIFIMELTPYGR